MTHSQVDDTPNMPFHTKAKVKRKMGKGPCCDKERVKKGAWSPEEDKILVQYIQRHGHGRWHALPKNAGLLRCGKSCRLRWTNYLRPGIKRGNFTPDEEATVIQLHSRLGNKWAAIASQLSGRTDNEIKNLWNTRLKKRISDLGQMSVLHQSRSYSKLINTEHESPSTRHIIQWERARVEAEARLSSESLLHSSSSNVNAQHDHHLHLWNSEVGESFRNVKVKDGGADHSSNSQMPSSTIICGSCSVDNTVQAMPIIAIAALKQDVFYKPHLHVRANSDSTGSNEFSDSSDTALKLLSDIPGGNDIEFIQGHTENFCNFMDLGSKY